MKNIQKKISAFTLIELLVVIVIIGILATVSTATFGGYFVKARDVERTATISTLYDIVLASQLGKDVVMYDWLLDGPLPNNGLFCSIDMCPAKQVIQLAEDQGFNIPIPVNGHNLIYLGGGGYIYNGIQVTSPNFGLAYCSESNPGELIIQGSLQEVMDLFQCNASNDFKSPIINRNTLDFINLFRSTVTQICGIGESGGSLLPVCDGFVGSSPFS